MEFLFDTANIKEIKTYGECFPYIGVTSNPSIIKAEGRINFFSHFREIRSIIGYERSLHIQVLASDYDGILREADAILSHVDERVYIKIPVTENGIKAIQTLKKRDVHTTATAIYLKIQGFMAINAGADFIAPYCNRMENQNIEPLDTISAFAKMIAKGYSTKILAASFKNMAQVNEALIAGAHTVTLQPALLHDIFGMAAIHKTVDDFKKDWVSVFGNEGILDMAKQDVIPAPAR